MRPCAPSVTSRYARRATSPVVFATVEERDRATSLLPRTEECGGGGPPAAGGWWRGRKAALTTHAH
jgi:hypothetical protein